MKKIKAIGITLLTTLISSSIALGANFSDTENHWGKEAIEELTAKKLVSGYEDGTFRPDNSITREEAATIIGRLVFENLNEINLKEKSIFKDIDNRYSTDYIKALAEKGIINGYEDGTFRPTTNISREEFSTILFRYIKRENVIDFKNKEEIKDFSKISDWAKEPISIMVGNKIINGDENGYFNPQNHIKRAEAAQLIYNVIKLKESNITVQKKYVKAVKNVELLKEPSENSQTIYNSSIKEGTELIVLKEEGDYYLVKTIKPEYVKKGFVKKTDVEILENKTPINYNERKMKVIDEVQLRLHPIKDSELIGRNSVLKPGDEVLVIGEATEYYLVKPLGIRNPFVGYGIKTAFEEIK